MFFLLHIYIYICVCVWVSSTAPPSKPSSRQGSRNLLRNLPGLWVQGEPAIYDKLAFNGDVMVIEWWFNGGLIVIYWDVVGFGWPRWFLTSLTLDFVK